MNVSDVLSVEHRAEKYYELFDENKKLRVYQDQLNKDVEILKNRLTYVKDKVLKRAKLTGEASGGKEFELIDENTTLKEENKKLRAIVKDLQKGGNRSGSENRSFNLGFDNSKELESIIGKLKERLKDNVVVISDLRTENELLRKGHSGKVADQRIMDEIRKKEMEVIQVSSSLDEVRMNYEAQSEVLQRARER
jgi:regulator of replication initiation timing